MNQSGKRVGVFVDITRQYRTASLVDSSYRIDYDKYLQQAVGSNELYRAYAYGVQFDNEANNFIMALNSIGYDVKYRQAINTNHDEKQQPKYHFPGRNLDMAMDVVRSLPFVDIVVLGTNHSEIIPLIEYVKEQGKKVHILSYSIPKDIRLSANKCYELDEEVLTYQKTNEATE